VLAGRQELDSYRTAHNWQLVSSRRGYISLKRYLALQSNVVNGKENIELFFFAFISL
jgi:hypothetical protein